MRECKRCLIRDLDERLDYENMFTYIKQLDKEIKTEEILYESRLAICKQCQSLINGMCKHCGCFVEMRAAVQSNYCPYKKW
ncbi:DUF6171 family protein [Cellulosilyticum sp. ST5]|uniref:Uncharacterized protein n=1 Tax=Cellulosilyticum lentocellum (strain ATCC 49066 / DSM 5427 / NCIMB 11756 / RHM5) TaxID=642492 RepID=F2JM81_CELLD|nr:MULTISPECIES: DUF6171 family protein [Cellulosilyticum]ADZ82292.1 hypothetical protein Clole_0556 [Cellulosilyticum lentocellum DSM 5427]QEH67978.1 hypothetical protein EKH84_06075 [Cellulosilyticum sp. WCF-2]